MLDTDQQRIAAAQYCVDQIQDGMLVGLGTGRAAVHAVKLLAERMQSGLKFHGLPTSKSTEKLALELGIPLLTWEQTTRLDITIDGADEVGPGLALIKGGGGALLHEKIVAAASDKMLVVGEAVKKVSKLGQFPLPVEVIPFGWQIVASKLSDLGGAPILRQIDGTTFITDEGNLILDCHFQVIEDSEALAQAIKSLVGVVEHGLFLNLASEAVLGTPDGIQILLPTTPADQFAA